MSLLERLLAQRRMVITAVLLLSLVGAGSWAGMIRQEDPSMPKLWGRIVVPFPGADAETIERLILEPLEENLAEVAGIKQIDSTARTDVAIASIELRETVEDPIREWDEIRNALTAAQREFPEGVGAPEVRDDDNESESIVLALTGSTDPLVLGDAAQRLKDELLTINQVSRVTVVGDPGEQITIELDDAAARRLDIDPQLLAGQLAQRNQVVPGGSIRLGGRQLAVRPASELRSLDELRQTPLVLASGAAVPLGEIAEVRLGPVEPEITHVRVDGRDAVVLGVVAQDDINLVQFGEMIRERVEGLRGRFAPLSIEEVIYQPAQVQTRLDDLGNSLLFGVAIVAAVLLLTMGPRLGFVVASVLPLVVLTAIALYAVGGGILHQISVAALVFALGMLVDNAIVVAESVQSRIDGGMPRREAALSSVRDLAAPLASATGTTLAVFVPMLAAEGVTAVFTRAIPIVVMLTLTVSYLFALAVTPMLARLFLRARNAERGASKLQGLASRLGRVAVGYPLSMVALALVLVGLAAMTAGQVRQQFFPPSDRNQLVVDLTLPDGAHLSETDQVARRLERELAARSDVVSVASFVGRSTPKFYYNLIGVPQNPNLAQLAITTVDTAAATTVQDWVRDLIHRELPEVEVVARKLQQGPSLLAPIEIRLYGEELASLATALEQVQPIIEAAPGAVDVRNDLGIGLPAVEVEIDDAAAARQGLSRSDVALSVLGRTRGIPVGQFRAGDDPIPMVLRSADGEDFPVDNLPGISVATPGGRPVPLAQVASLSVEWRPAVIRHREGQRLVRVLAELEDGETFSSVLTSAGAALEALDLPEGVRLEIGGEAEGSGEANQALARAAPLGALLLLGILLAEFNSFRRVGIILVTVPLAAVGVVPGLLLANQPFGFMSLLGVIALIGVVVNNAIVLLDVIEKRRDAGASVSDAVRAAVERRTRPILLTTTTTVAGLTPLAFTSSTFWPPMAWAMISGLLGSTFLTLLVVPALYRLAFDPPRFLRPTRWFGARARQAAGAGLLALAFLGGFAHHATAQESAPPSVREDAVERVSLLDAMRRAGERPRAQAAEAGARALDAGAEAERRAAVLPAVGAGLSYRHRDRELELSTPFGPFSQGEKKRWEAGLELTQPLLDPARLFHTAPAAALEAKSAWAGTGRTRDLLAAGAAGRWLDVLGFDARRQAIDAFIASLEGQLEESENRVREGRALEADALKVRLALDGARQEGLQVDQGRQVALFALGQAIGQQEPAEPTGPLPTVPESLGPLDELTEASLGRREDLLALDLLRQALVKRASGVRAELLPRLDASVAVSWTDADVYTTSTWTEGAITLSWNPFASGTRKARAEAIRAQEDAVEAEIEEARRSLELELRAALAALTTARGALQVSQRGIEQAAETARVERERFQAGRTTTNDLLEAEAALKDQRTRHELARLEIVRSWIALRLAQGDL